MKAIPAHHFRIRLEGPTAEQRTFRALRNEFRHVLAEHLISLRLVDRTSKLVVEIAHTTKHSAHWIAAPDGRGEVDTVAFRWEGATDLYDLLVRQYWLKNISEKAEEPKHAPKPAKAV